MRNLKTTIIILFLSLHLSGQDTITWKYTEGGEMSCHKKTVLRLTHIAPGDPITFDSDQRIIDCVSEGMVFMDIVPMEGSVHIGFCDDSVNMPLLGDFVQMINKNDLFFKLVVTEPEKDPEVSRDKVLPKSKIDVVQNVFNDAFILYSGDKAQRILVFSKYNIDENTETNTFIEKLQKTTFDRSAGLHGFTEDDKSQGRSAISGITGLEVTKYVDGLAKFLVSRVKQELAILYFDNFSKAIRDPDVKDIQFLFRNTYGQLDLLGDEIYDFKPYLNSIREGMENDFKKLPESVHALIKNEESQLYSAINSKKNMGFIINTSLDFAQALKENEHAGTALAQLPSENDIIGNTDPALIGILRTLQLFSEAFRNSPDETTSNYWVERDKINALLNNDMFLIYFMGLVTHLAKSKNIQFSAGKSLFQTLNTDIGPANIKLVRPLIQVLKSSFFKIQGIHHQYISATQDEIKGNLIGSYFDAAGELITAGNELVRLFNLDAIKPEFQIFLNIFNDLNGLVKSVSVKKYAVATTHLAHLIKTIVGKPNPIGWEKTIAFIIEKAPFIGQMAEAKTSDQVDSLLQIYAAPIGSWRDKRIAKFNVALDSYIGPAAFFSNSESRITLSTPVGPSVTFGGKNYQITALMSLVDIGPITSFRFKNDTSEVSKISLNEILSPGFLFSFQLGKNFPFSFNLGYQEYPLLKRVLNSSNDINIKRTPGFTVSFNFNIPILTLSNKKVSSE